MSVSLVEARLNRGLSITALSEEADVPEHVIRHAEKGGRPRPENALRLADVLEVRVTDLWPVERLDAA
jgi:predicted transcriptional regulator